MQQIFSQPPAFPLSDTLQYARVRGPTRAYITLAALSAISYRVIDAGPVGGVAPGVTDPLLNTEVGADTVTIDDTTVFNTMQTHTQDEGWPAAGQDAAPGFNFRHLLPGANLPLGGRIYEIHYQATPQLGSPYGPYFWVCRQPTLAPLVPTPTP